MKKTASYTYIITKHCKFHAIVYWYVSCWCEFFVGWYEFVISIYWQEYCLLSIIWSNM